MKDNSKHIKGLIIPPQKLREAIDESLYEIFHHERHSILLEYYSSLNNNQASDPIFPPNKYIISVYSNDHWPPHFHIETDNLNVALTIWKGEVLQVKGKDSQSEMDYIINNALPWLNMRSVSNKRKTNRNLLINLWNTIHPEMPISYILKNSQRNIRKNFRKRQR